MGVSGCCLCEGEFGYFGCFGGFVIKVINDFYVVSNEVNWSDDNRLYVLFGKIVEVIDNVWFKLWVVGMF